MENITFDDLFACRFQYQDYTMDEYVIIRKLKLFLLNNGMDTNFIDNYLFQFYVAFGHPITLEEIKEVSTVPTFNNLFNNINIPNNINITNNNTESFDIIEDENDDSNLEEESQSTTSDTIPITEDSGSYHINITYDDITYDNNTIPINITSNNIDQTELFNSLYYNSAFSAILHSMFTTTTGVVSNIPPPQPSLYTDVVVTTDNDYLDKLKTIILTENTSDKCSICMMLLEKDDTILDIECKHNFHKECLLQYLKDYNHICPICRHEIGPAKINY